MHGKVFVVGSEEEQLALQVMGEPRCRCRPVPFFDDPGLDTPQEVYEQEKKEWAAKWLDERTNNEIGKIIATNQSWNIAEQAKERLSEDTKFLLAVAGESKESRINSKISEFKSKFVSPPIVEKIYKRHMIAERGGFTFDDVITRLESKPYGYSKAKNNALILDESKRLAIIINPENKVITAYKVRTKTIKQLKKNYKDKTL